MDLKNEKLQILKMIEEGKVSSEEGVKLLEALEGTSSKTLAGTPKAKWIKIKVFDPDDKTNVDVNIPISLINIGLKIANKVAPDFNKYGLDENEIHEIFESIKAGASGKILDINSENGEKIEIIVE